MKVLPKFTSTSTVNSMSLNAQANAISRPNAIDGRNPHVTALQDGHISSGNTTENVISIAATSPSTSRASLTSLPISLGAIAQTGNESTASAAQFYGSARRTAFVPDPADKHLMLFRNPPPYTRLDEKLTQEKERRSQPRSRLSKSLDGEALINRHEKWALTALQTMKNKTNVEMKSTFVQTVPSLATSIPRRTSSILHSLPSFAASSSASTMEPTSVQGSRNPFRKRVLSYPDMPAFGGGASMQNSDKASSTCLPDFVSMSKTAMKASENLSRDLSTTMGPRTKSKLNPKPRTSMPSASASNVSSVPSTSSAASRREKRIPLFSPTTSTNSRPLMPISAVKVPILPDDVRQEALRRETKQISLLSRKRDRPAEDGQDLQEPATKKVARSTSMGKIKTKDREMEKAKAFDWASWGKTGLP
ncbi:hypothetical protein BDN70DRAFT_882183 [Pholiota conissans]|uniref:Uncharacterized protein n=1 Tax=Pholiota conissans TaxID=109636 RepID=A0A9P5YZ75_9AGAR|nr:hypothetical protein BDN70DRAFT_882183 [Pholiota conissans]